jgi:hypothetical protein
VPQKVRVTFLPVPAGLVAAAEVGAADAAPPAEVAAADAPLVAAAAAPEVAAAEVAAALEPELLPQAEVRVIVPMAARPIRRVVRLPSEESIELLLP